MLEDRTFFSCYLRSYLVFTATGLTVGCKSNSECAGSEACINALCINPCNCGPNAECRVVNHYPICYCQPGYSGNPQLGCIKSKLLLFNAVSA